MLDSLLNGVFSAATIQPLQFFLCLGTALAIGALLGALYTRHSRFTTSFLVTLALLPAIVCVVILLVNGSIGTGVAVAGAFSLVRFRSQPGSAREIGSLFLAMTAGLACGMGYLGYAVLFTLILGTFMLLLDQLSQRLPQRAQDKTLRITIPEDLDYCQLFDDLFDEYTAHWESVAVKSTNLGSLFRLTYHVTLKDPKREKEFLDALRCRNGNLEIALSNQEANNEL